MNSSPLQKHIRPSVLISNSEDNSFVDLANPFICPFGKHLMNTYCVPGTITVAKETRLAVHGVHSLEEEVDKPNHSHGK